MRINGSMPMQCSDGVKCKKRGVSTAKCCRAFSDECPGVKVLSLVPWFSPSPGKEKGKAVEGIV